MAYTILYPQKKWTIDEGNCPITLQIDHPHFGTLEIGKMQRKEIDCKDIAKIGTILFEGNTYKVVRVYIEEKQKTPYMFDWYYITVDPNPQ